MWDVKGLQEDLQELQDLTFYLNYVGCKVFQEYEVLYKVHSFTLTMWDVKIIDTIVLTFTGEVLP